MNYGRRTTNTTTHRDTPLSATPEPLGIDRLQPRKLPEYKSAAQYNVDNDARREAKRKLEEGANRKLRKNKS